MQLLIFSPSHLVSATINVGNCMNWTLGIATCEIYARESTRIHQIRLQTSILDVREWCNFNRCQRLFSSSTKSKYAIQHRKTWSYSYQNPFAPRAAYRFADNWSTTIRLATYLRLRMSRPGQPSCSKMSRIKRYEYEIYQSRTTMVHIHQSHQRVDGNVCSRTEPNHFRD